MVVPREEDESSKGQGVREAEEEEEGLKGEEEEAEVLEEWKVSFKYIVCLSLKEVNMIERTQLTVAWLHSSLLSDHRGYHACKVHQAAYSFGRAVP